MLKLGGSESAQRANAGVGMKHSWKAHCYTLWTCAPPTENKNTNEDRLASSHVCMKYLTRLSSLNIHSDVFCFVLECQTM